MHSVGPRRASGCVLYNLNCQGGACITDTVAMPSSRTWVATLLLLATALGVAKPAQAQELPHVKDCNFCSKCYLTKDKNPNATPPALDPELLSQDLSAIARKIVPSKGELHAKALKPNCTECWGCTTQIQPLQAVSAFGHDFKVEPGASPEWLFNADLPDTHITGKRAIVKVWCVPYDKQTNATRHKCDAVEIAFRGSQHLVALDRITTECGMEDITIRVWLAPVNAIMPGTGLHIYWYGLWMERAEGLSLNQLAYLGRRDLVQDVIMDLLQTKLNKTRVVRAALYDLLISQCDRHAQNVFINEHGNIKLIDNLNSLRLSWLHCGTDSIFLPGTQKNEIVRFGGTLVSKRLGAKPKRTLNPMIVLDYRCYVDSGKIGTNYPPSLAQCLRKFSSMSPVELRAKYGFSDTYIAEHLVTRSADMLQKGFEWTLRRGKPVNKASLRYRWHQPCCKIAHALKHGVQCAHPWNATAEFPLGDPLRGGPWKWTYPDPGKYDGDQLWT